MPNPQPFGEDYPMLRHAELVFLVLGLVAQRLTAAGIVGLAVGIAAARIGPAAVRTAPAAGQVVLVAGRAVLPDLPALSTERSLAYPDESHKTCSCSRSLQHFALAHLIHERGNSGLTGMA